MLHLRPAPTGNPVPPATASGESELPPGLDPLIINSFPTFTYSSIKDFRKEKYGLECAICLNEFEDQSILRLLTKCSHVFHQECIDLWLKTNTSCPVCRQSLDTTEKSPEKSPARPVHYENDNVNENGSLEGTISINISDHLEDGKRIEESEGQPNKVQGFFARSKSTGHSIVRISREKKEDQGEESDDRFRLILPDLVKAKFIIGQNFTRSCTTFGEYKSRTCIGHGGFTEV